MRIGSMDRRIVLQRLIATGVTDLNEAVTDWQAFATVWAALTPLSEAERVEAAKKTATRSIRFRVRWRDDVDETARILHDGLAYEITGVREIGRRVALEITAEAKI